MKILEICLREEFLRVVYVTSFILENINKCLLSKEIIKQEQKKLLTLNIYQKEQ